MVTLKSVGSCILLLMNLSTQKKKRLKCIPFPSFAIIRFLLPFFVLLSFSFVPLSGKSAFQGTILYKVTPTKIDSYRRYNSEWIKKQNKTEEILSNVFSLIVCYFICYWITSTIARLSLATLRDRDCVCLFVRQSWSSLQPISQPGCMENAFYFLLACIHVHVYAVLETYKLYWR